MLKSFISSKAKTLLAATVIAGAAVGVADVAPAHAVTLTGGGTGIEGFKANEWVHLIYPQGQITGSDPIAGVIILQSLSSTEAKLRIRIDNKLSGAREILSVAFDVNNGRGLGTPPNVTDVPGNSDTDRLTSASISGSGSNTPTVNISAPINGLAVGAFDEFLLTLTRPGGADIFNVNTGISLSGLSFDPSGTGQNGRVFSGTFSTVPTPALLPGLLGLAAGVLRKKHDQEETLEESEV